VWTARLLMVRKNAATTLDWLPAEPIGQGWTVTKTERGASLIVAVLFAIAGCGGAAGTPPSPAVPVASPPGSDLTPSPGSIRLLRTSAAA
jgi:hypothetical protein